MKIGKNAFADNALSSITVPYDCEVKTRVRNPSTESPSEFDVVKSPRHWPHAHSYTYRNGSWVSDEPPIGGSSAPAIAEKPAESAEPAASAGQIIDLTDRHYGLMDPIEVEMGKSYRLKYDKNVARTNMIVIAKPSGDLPIEAWTEGSLDTKIALDSMTSVLQALSGAPVLTENDVQIKNNISASNKNSRISFVKVPNGAHLNFIISADRAGTYILHVSAPKHNGGYF
jgi:hypothetical protein